MVDDMKGITQAVGPQSRLRLLCSLYQQRGLGELAVLTAALCRHAHWAPDHCTSMAGKQVAVCGQRIGEASECFHTVPSGMQVVHS